MCRLLGIYGRTDIWREIAVAFGRQAQYGNIPPEETQDPGHQDGWGIAMANSDHTAMIPVIRQLGAAHAAPGYREVIYATPDMPGVLLCHLRKASDIIPITLANAHPFVHNGWAIIHNGTAFDAHTLPRDPDLVTTSDGSDSEHYFHYLLSRIGGRPPGRGVAKAIGEAVAAINVEYSALNCILSNGREMYALRHYRQWEDYYTLYTCALPGSLVVSSQPVDLPQIRAERWEPVSAGRLLRIYGTPPKVEQFEITPIS